MRRTATPVASSATQRHPAVRSEFESLVLNERQRAVNRKVQGSNPCPGANFRVQVDRQGPKGHRLLRYTLSADSFKGAGYREPGASDFRDSK